MPIVAFLHLIRWKNIALVLYTQCIIKFVFFNVYEINETLSNFNFTLYLVAIISIIAGGYVINDICDLETDLINKPKKVVITKFISLKNSKISYKVLTSLGVILGVILSFNIGKPLLSFIFIFVALLLYLYSKYLKSKALIGNFIVAFLIAFSILTLTFFDVNNYAINYNHNFVLSVIYIVSFFAFCLSFIREIVKDIEDINGDYQFNMNTLPILLGRNRMKKLTAIIGVFPSFFLMLIILYLFPENKIVAIYLFIFILIPLLFII